MNALALIAPHKMEVREIATPTPQPNEVLLRVGAVGLCGTDFHIFEGHANYRRDAAGRLIPMEEEPLILGHEFCGIVEEVGNAVKDVAPGDWVVVDQGWNCLSYKQDLCEYCATGDSHQCANYAEHGITGPQGALAEFVAVPAINTVRIENELPLQQAALTEPLGCITHTMAVVQKTQSRYQFNSDKAAERPIKSVLICGAGPAGLLFTQYIRNVIGFDGLVIVTEPSEKRRKLAEEFGATGIDPTTTDLVEAVNDLTKGERIQLLIESAGVAPLFKQIPNLIRKQATVVLYGHGHHGVDLGVMNNIQFIEPTLIAPTGASGGFDSDGRPSTYRQSLELIASGKINVSKIITHHYHSLADVPAGFAQDHFGADYIKGVAVFS
ncbi:MAG: alcohol dehydrogenase catalytic domain-containing protein [Acidobacteriota bacterium]|nr:alcohol dehydrogenase catalytic domain-containing protein [Acidobacteriota bacterium]